MNYVHEFLLPEAKARRAAARLLSHEVETPYTPMHQMVVILLGSSLEHRENLRMANDWLNLSTQPTDTKVGWTLAT